MVSCWLLVVGNAFGFDKIIKNGLYNSVTVTVHALTDPNHTICCCVNNIDGVAIKDGEQKNVSFDECLENHSFTLASSGRTISCIAKKCDQQKMTALIYKKLDDSYGSQVFTANCLDQNTKCTL